MSFKLNISPVQFANLVGCSSNHVRYLIQSSEVNSVRVGKNYRFHEEEVNQYIYSKENLPRNTPSQLTKEKLEHLLIDYPNLFSTRDFMDFFDITNVTALSIIKEMPYIKYGNRGGYKVRKAVIIDYILENQTMNTCDPIPNKSE